MRGGAAPAFAVAMIYLMAMVLCLCNWEHVYLFVRYYRATGKPAWPQVLRILHNVAFMLLVWLLIIAGVGIPASVDTGVWANRWPLQVAVVVILIILLKVLAKWTLFNRPASRTAGSMPSIR
jgi:hypothetical protein